MIKVTGNWKSFDGRFYLTVDEDNGYIELIDAISLRVITQFDLSKDIDLDELDDDPGAKDMGVSSIDENSIYNCGKKRVREGIVSNKNGEKTFEEVYGDSIETDEEDDINANMYAHCFESISNKGKRLKESEGEEKITWDSFSDPVSNRLESKYLPSEGDGDTLATQAVTATSKLIYKWFNDGDVYDNTHALKGWMNDISSQANWLAKNIPGAKEILMKIEDISEEQEYTETILYPLFKLIFNEEKLRKLNLSSKKGSVYDCDGRFKFFEEKDDEDEDDEWDWSEDDDDLDESKKIISKRISEGVATKKTTSKSKKETDKKEEKKLPSTISLHAGTLDIVTNESAELYPDHDGWDDRSDMIDDLNALSDNANDAWSEEIDEELEEYGIMIDSSKNHKVMDINSDNPYLILNLTKISK